MRLYHRTIFIFSKSFAWLLIILCLWGCSTPHTTAKLITVTIAVDKKDLQVKLAPGSSVREALKSAQAVLGDLDRVVPSQDQVLSDGSQIAVIRVREEYYTEEVNLPFDYQEVKNEALPAGDRRLSQLGVNGMEEYTYRRVYEDGIEISHTLVKSVIMRAATTEVVMIGSPPSFNPIPIPGRIAFIAGGNAWMLDGNTGNRRLVVSTGDLDGRVFSLSKNGSMLLFTRFSKDKNLINSLWAVNTDSRSSALINLGINNVIHSAEFNPDSTIIAYSTAQWRETSPGWQANNDLLELGFNSKEPVGIPQLILEANSGGVYGWWGTQFSWSPDQARYLFSRPDAIGLIDRLNGSQRILLNITPYQTGGNWAWVPEAAWSPDGKVIYTVNLTNGAGSGLQKAQKFDLIGIPLTGGAPVTLIHDVGMFAYPMPSPMTVKQENIYNSSGDVFSQQEFSVAYLQAIFPEQSDSSTYRLCTIDRDGSNRKCLFPIEGQVGLDPQRVVWSPSNLGTGNNYAIAVIYNGDLWIVNSESGAAQQITGDGLTSRVDWR